MLIRERQKQRRMYYAILRPRDASRPPRTAEDRGVARHFQRRLRPLGPVSIRPPLLPPKRIIRFAVFLFRPLDYFVHFVLPRFLSRPSNIRFTFSPTFDFPIGRVPSRYSRVVTVAFEKNC